MESNTGKLINAIKDDPTIAERLLYPGKQLSDYDVDKLAIKVLPSGFPSFDKYFVFKQSRGELILIGARPSKGKSALLLQVAGNIAEYGKSHVISLEDGHEAIATRMTARMLNRPMDAVQRGLVPRNDLLYAQECINRLNIVIDDRGGLNVHQICDAARMQHRKAPVSAVFIDYIQIIHSDRKNSRVEDIAAISSELKKLAKELNCPVVVASQLNRNGDFREDKTPQLSDLKESGALEQDADVVLLIHREGEAAKIIVAKNKNGPTGEIEMKYAGAQCRFIDCVSVQGDSID